MPVMVNREENKPVLALMEKTFILMSHSEQLPKIAETGEILFEITTDGESKILVQGGRGGLGNVHFKSATQQTPRFAQPGEPFVEGWFTLELKILADVGLVGLP